MHALGSGAGVLGAFFVMAVIAVVVVLIVLMATRKPHMAHMGMQPTGPVPTANRFADALAIAADRFAKGEITKEQYDEIRTTLGG